MNQIKELKMDIAASLWIVPCSEAELMERDFLKNRSPEMIQRLLLQMETDKWIYMKGDMLFCYGRTVKHILNPNGYEL